MAVFIDNFSLFENGGSFTMQGTVILIIVLVVLIVNFSIYIYLIKNPKKLFIVMKSNAGEPLPGIPFYIRMGQYIHETSYLETLATFKLSKIRVTLDENDKPIRSDIESVLQKTFSYSSDYLTKEHQIIRNITDAQKEQNPRNQENLFKTAVNLLNSLPSYNGSIPESFSHIEKNTIEQRSFVDYGNMYYLNKYIPLIGSSDLEIDLAPDGTLSKTVGKTEDRALEELTKLVPLETLISKIETKAEVLEEDFKKAIKVNYKFSWSIEQTYVRHIFFMILPEVDTKHLARLEPNLNEYYYRREIHSELKSTTNEKESTPTVIEDKKQGNTGN